MKLIINALTLPGTYEVVPQIIEDNRGTFVKVFQKTDFDRVGLFSDFHEVYFSVSNANVIRGMHFQAPPHAHAKLVYCAVGNVLDVVVDLRHGASYGKTLALELNAEKRNMLYIPAGCAHGFRTFENPAMLVYHVTSEYHAPSDTGVLWHSIDYDWNISRPIVSERDARFISFKDLVSPF